MERAAEIVRLSTEETEKPERTPVQEYLAKIGRKGGLKGGKARAESMSPRRRRSIAAKAAAARWEKKK
jgi:hypothetical protein